LGNNLTENIKANAWGEKRTIEKSIKTCERDSKV
jgi:hypothetical protein